MKRYDFANYGGPMGCSCYMRPDDNEVEYVLYSDAKARIDAWRKCAGYAVHRGTCELSSDDYEKHPLGTRKCTCGLVEAFAAAGA